MWGCERLCAVWGSSESESCRKDDIFFMFSYVESFWGSRMMFMRKVFEIFFWIITEWKHSEGLSWCVFDFSSMEVVYAGFRGVPLVVTLYSTDMLHLHYILLYIIYFKMACDEDMLPFECLICFRQFMTLVDLDCHVFETYGSLWHRFNTEIDFMPDFRRCLQCDVLDAVYEFAGIMFKSCIRRWNDKCRDVWLITGGNHRSRDLCFGRVWTFCHDFDEFDVPIFR
jgi:hypothetical protein